VPPAGFAGPGGGAHAHPGADGEERQHERPAGQRQRLPQQLPAEGEGPAARHPAAGPDLHPRGLREGGFCRCGSQW